MRITGDSESLERAAARSGIALEILGKDADKSSGSMKNWESHIPIVGGLLDSMNRSLLNVTGSLVSAIPGMEGLGQSIQSASPMLAAFMSWGEAIPAAMFLATFAVVGLADTIGILAAIVGDLVAPVTLVTGLLGLLGIGFVLAAQKAFGKGGGLAGALDGLKKQFDTLTSTLEGRFMPIFRQLAGDASSVLGYLNKIAHLPLDQAFKSLATTGVQAVTKFLQQAGSMLAHPIKLALQLAFGGGTAGNEVSSAVSSLWNQLTHYWVGYTKTQKLMFNGHVVITKTQVNGALQPFLTWWDNHDFTKQGIRLGHEILNGFERSGAAHAMGQALITVIEDAARTGAKSTVKAMADAFGQVNRLNQQYSQNEKQDNESAWHAIASTIVSVSKASWDSFVHNMDAAWQATKYVADQVWGAIRSAFEHPLSVIINWPSPPAWVLELWGDITGSGSGGGGATKPKQVPPNVPNIASGGVHYHSHYHAPVVGEAAVERTVAKALTMGARRGIAGAVAHSR